MAWLLIDRLFATWKRDREHYQVSLKGGPTTTFPLRASSAELRPDHAIGRLLMRHFSGRKGFFGRGDSQDKYEAAHSAFSTDHLRLKSFGIKNADDR